MPRLALWAIGHEKKALLNICTDIEMLMFTTYELHMTIIILFIIYFIINYFQYFLARLLPFI